MQKTYVAASLDMALPYPDDQALTYMTEEADQKLVRPFGVQNLRQWGNMVLPEGKHKGKTFLETVECGYQYSMWIVKHKNLTSDWTKSFQEFVKACTGSECQGQISSQDVRRLERCGAGADCHPIGHEVGGKDEPELARQRLPCFRGSSPK